VRRILRAGLLLGAAAAAYLGAVRAGGQTRPSADPDTEGQTLRQAMRGQTAQLALRGKTVAIRYHPQLQFERDAAQPLAALQAGQVLPLARAAAIRLRTETDLAFGSTVVPAGNHAPGYPGIYSLWLKRAQDGWRLVFNAQPDVWGTQHDRTHDVVEVPLEWKPLAPAVERLSVELRADGAAGGLVRLAWGPNEWTARCSVAPAVK